MIAGCTRFVPVRAPTATLPFGEPYAHAPSATLWCGISGNPAKFDQLFTLPDPSLALLKPATNAIARSPACAFNVGVATGNAEACAPSPSRTGLARSTPFQNVTDQFFCPSVLN